MPSARPPTAAHLGPLPVDVYFRQACGVHVIRARPHITTSRDRIVGPTEVVVLHNEHLLSSHAVCLRPICGLLSRHFATWLANVTSQPASVRGHQPVSVRDHHLGRGIRLLCLAAYWATTASCSYFAGSSSVVALAARTVTPDHDC